MPSFEYKALNAKGQEMLGKINAVSAAQAIKDLQAKALYPLDVKKIPSHSDLLDSKKNRFKLGFKLFKKSVNLNILADFSRQFGMLIDTGVPYNRGLQILSQSTKHGLMNEVISEMNLKVLEGVPLAKAMADYPDVFPVYYRTAVAAGEKTGHLGENLVQQSDFLESQVELKNRLQSAMIYPGIMTALGIGITIFMIQFILPRITPIFESFDKALPLPTRIMIATSDFFSEYSYFILLGLVGILFLLNHYLKKSSGKAFFDKLLLRLPLFGGLFKKVYLLRFSLAFSSLLGSGIDVKEALNISRTSTGNTVFKDAIEDIWELTVNKGYTLSQALSKNKLFDEKFVQVVRVGEESGKIEIMIKKLSGNLRTETQASIQKFVSFLEPIIILSMALMIGSIVLSILLPIFEMNQLINVQ